MLNQFGLNNMKTSTSPILRFIAIIHWLAAIGYIFAAPLLGYFGALGSQALLLFFLPLIAGVLFVVQAGLLGNDREKSTVLAALLTVYFLFFLLITPGLDLIPHIGLGISGSTLLYLIVTNQKK